MKLEVENLTCGYEGRPVLSDFSVTIETEQVFCLLGPNGVGKTTLFRTILGLLPRIGGRVDINGVDFLKLPERERARHAAYVPQESMPPFAFDVLDVVMMGRIAERGLFASPTSEDITAAHDVLERMRIEHLAKRTFNELSGGERQMVTIARALAQYPAFLFMDEPTSSLDFGNQVRVLKVIRHLASEGLGVVMTTHNPDHLSMLEARGTLLMREEAPVFGYADELLDPTLLHKAYGIDCVLTKVPLDRTGSKERVSCQALLE